MNWNQYLPYLAPLIVLALLTLRLVRNRPRKLRLGVLFVRPVIILVLVGVVLAVSPMPTLVWIAGYAAAMALGAVAGFFTTHHQEFAIDYDTGEITSRATPIGAVLILILFAARFGVRYATVGMGGNPYEPGQHVSPDVIAAANASLMFAAGFILARVGNTWLRARKLIVEHRAKKGLVSPQ